MKNNKIKQFSVMLSLLLLSNNDINIEEFDNLLGNNHTIYQEIDNPIYGNVLFNAYVSLPNYIKKFLVDNSLEIIVTGNNDYIENIYKKLYDTEIENKSSITIDYDGKLIAIIEGCCNDKELRKIFNKDYSKEKLIKANLSLMMYYQVGNLIDRYFGDISKSSYFSNCYIQEIKNFQLQLAFGLGLNDTDINMKEYFATTYACYLAYPVYLKRICPYTYDFFDNYVKELIMGKSKIKKY